MRPIDADALIERCGDWYTEEGTEVGFIGTLKSLLDEQPTIEPEQKVGKWEKHGEGIYCSECKCESGYNWYGASVFSRFCPNCGADMREEQP